MSWRAGIFTAWTSVVFILATLLLSNPGDERAAPRAEAELTALDLLVMPIGRSQPAELRLLVLPVGLAGLLLIAALFPPATVLTSVSANKKACITSEGLPSETNSNFVTAYWLELLSAATIVIALLSTYANDSWLISRGWLLQLAAGCGWAVLISRLVDRRLIQHVLVASSLVALVAIALSFGHRQAHHVEYFAWPIGPVTMSAGMAAIWAAMGVSIAIACVPRAARVSLSRPALILTSILVLSSVAVLVIAARRGAWLAVLGAVVFTTMFLAWRRPTKRARAIAVLGAAAIVVLAAAYVFFQSRSDDPSASIPITYRFIYWKNTIENLADHWLLGHGPDSFLGKMSAIIAGQRARMPHVLHGTIDPEAHNEWLQAIFEIGVPGGLAYLIIPLIAVFCATRTALRGDRPAVPLAIAAGLVAILISEAGSICLRRGGMNVWYWTLVGAAVVWSRRSNGHPSQAIAHWRLIPILGRLAAVTAALALALIVSDECRRRIAHARGNVQSTNDNTLAAQTLAKAGWRLGAWQALAARADLGDAQLAASRSSKLNASEAVATLSELHRYCPAYPGAAFRLAQAQQLAGDASAACETLKRHIATINPNDMAAGMLFVASCPLAPRATLEHVRRGLRDGEWMTAVEPKLAESFGDSEIATAWPGEVLVAIRAVRDEAPAAWADTSTPETLRIEAARFAALRDYAAAARIQAVAARAYERLEKEHSPFRRAAFAEADVSFRYAYYLFHADPLKSKGALYRLREAERLALGGVPQRAVTGADHRAEWVGGQVVPAEFPPRLRPLWRFGAMLHLAAGSDPRIVQQRAEWSLPADRQSPQDSVAQICEIAAELVELFSPIEPGNRPAHFANLVTLADQNRPAPAAQRPNP